MSMAINMPLGGLIDKSLRGEARFAHEEWLRTYVKRLTNGNKTKLKQALNEVDEAINQWRNGFWKIQCKLPPKTKRFCPLVLK